MSRSKVGTDTLRVYICPPAQSAVVAGTLAVQISNAAATSGLIAAPVPREGLCCVFTAWIIVYALTDGVSRLGIKWRVCRCRAREQDGAERSDGTRRKVPWTTTGTSMWLRGRLEYPLPRAGGCNGGGLVGRGVTEAGVELSCAGPCTIAFWGRIGGPCVHKR